MIEILCTITGIVAGVAIVASLMQGRGSRTQQFVRRSPSDDAPESAQMHGIADQLRLLSFRVAADVTAHSEKVEAINGRLAEPDSGPPQLLSAINELIAANQTMQGQLADARKRIAHQSEMIEEAAQLARTDALTGLANRRALNEFLQNCLGAIRPGEFAGLLLMDIDHFKTFNDDYGHTTGDAVLAAFARNIKKWCNQECYPARYGGEEFAVILTGRDQKAIAQKSSDLRKFVSEQTITFEDLQLSITASAGLCILAVGDSLQSAYDRSDEGLYNAKKSGRNCGFWLNDSNWEPLPEPTTQTFTTNERKRIQSAEELIRESQQRANRPDQPSDPEKLIRSDAGSDPKGRDDEPEEAVESVRSVRQDAAYGDVLDKETFSTRMTR
ncbi:MAG: GGDEF domain-containing protein [Pirellulales bacterium]